MSRNTKGMPTVTTISAIMSPRRLRSSINLVVIMAPVGTHDPRRSCRLPAGGRRPVAISMSVVTPRPPVGS